MLKIGTRDSKLALWQAEYTQAELRRIGVESELVIFKIYDKSTGNEIEAALQRGEINLTTHAMNDLPTSQAEGLVITAVSQRDNPAELLLLRPEAVGSGQIFKLKTGAIVGASAPQQKAQLLDFRPDIELREPHGEPEYRLQKLRDGACEAIFLAAADAARLALNLDGLEVLELNPREFIPAPAQGVLAWQTHRDDLPTRRILKQIHHPEISALTNVERNVQQLLGDQTPLGVFVERDAAGNLHAFAAGEIGGELRRVRVSQSTSFGLAEKIIARLNEE